MLRFFLHLLTAATLLLPFGFAAVAVNHTHEVSGNFSHVPLSDLAQESDYALSLQDNMPKKWKGIATIEVYVISDRNISVGYVTGPMMYDLIQRTLKAECPDTIGGQSNKKCWEQWHPFDTRYKDGQGRLRGTLDQIHVISSSYKNRQVRNLLIGSIAAAYEAATEMPRNCYYAPDPEAGFRYCNAPNKVGAYTEDSHIYIEMSSDVTEINDGGWHCCETRELVDPKLDTLVGEFKSVYPKKRSKDREVICDSGCTNDQREFNVNVDVILAELENSGL